MVLVLTALAGCAGGSTGGGTDARITRSVPTAGLPTGGQTVRPAAPAGTTAPASTIRRHLNYVYPVRGCSSSPSASHHDYPASDIFTQRGCRFVATTRGRIDEVSRRDRWDPGVDSGGSRGGRYVSLVGDDGVRYYGSHLLRVAKGIKPGVRVRAGQLLGRIDNSGDARYTPTHVHYGISWPTRHHIWWVRRGEVWPQRFLSAWRDGEDRSPARAVRRKHRQLGTVPKCQVEC
ncbi:MAG: peptidoglycan LD-endopeptidase LytH [Frankiaceae bacterium]|jgi:murein DD-endopeptidase MepM/ murein hydrolase activator NlpD|nr:peptidoglycan LD-endopeptidase LytH [Frankiaceae bacterium]